MTLRTPVAAAAHALHSSLQDPAFSASVIDWQRQHGRHKLPWQQSRDAYRIWLSEIMLQQTQVSAVIPYYQKFLQRFPTVFDLASAPVELVMEHWSGLGYYTRARNLHRCAKQVVEQYQGQFPADPAHLAELPGIGRSTAAAITAFAYGTVAAILDGNVKRVFARVFGIDGYPGSKPVEDAMWQRAVALLPEQGIEAYTQGLMDLGATVCTRSKPDCGHCPLQQRCVAFAQNRVAELPVRKPKTQQRQKQAVMLILLHEGRVLLERRPDSGIWGGLLSLPELDGMQPLAPEQDTPSRAATPERVVLTPELHAWIARFGAARSVQVLPSLQHVFTHFRLHIQPVLAQLEQRVAGVGQDAEIWLPLDSADQAALPAPVKTLLQSLTQPLLF